MQIFFQTKKISLDEAEQDFMARRIECLDKFFSKHARCFVDVEKTRADNNGKDLYEVTFNIEDGSVRYFAEEYQSSVRKAFDHAYQEIYRSIRNERGRSRAILKQAGRAFKSLFKRRYK